MKLSLLLLCLLTGAATFAQPGYRIDGQITSTRTPAAAYLRYEAKGKPAVDSAVINGGKFTLGGASFSAGKAALTIRYQDMPASDETDRFMLYLSHGLTEITITDTVRKAVIVKSPILAPYQRYVSYTAAAEEEITRVSADYRQASEATRQDPAFRAGLDKRYAAAAALLEEQQFRYIQEVQNPYFSLIALKDIISKTNQPRKADSLFKLLPRVDRQSDAGRTVAKQIATALLTAVGAVAPDFTQRDTADKAVKLSDFRGKYVLVDFWASWCGPCRAENPNLVKVYNQYKDKNFTILGVSLDQPGKKDAWLAAIHADGLQWTQVSDLLFWNNAVAKQYGIKFIPQNVLIGPDGKIIAKNLRGEHLSAALAALPALQ